MATVEQTPTRTARPKVLAPNRSKLVGKLGPWQLMRQIGEGDVTRVYLARPDDVGNAHTASYAVKVLRNEWWRDESAIARQRREAWIGGQVSHPNVVPVLSTSVEGPPFYFVMPMLEGRSLAQRIEDGPQLPLPMALWIVRQIVEGLAAVFGRTRMIHGDVKPANVMVAPSGHATVMDFGLAHTLDEASSWADRPVIGTLNYIAPEMVTSAMAADARSDFYSLGVMLYELLAGRLPLESDDPGELAMLHREGKPTCVLELRSDLPKPVASLVHTLLAKEPIRRPSSHSELIERLVRLEIDCFGMR
jgi:serine/threonine-protein kinase